MERKLLVKMQNKLLFFLLLLMPIAIFSQNFIQGRLLDTVSKQPVVFANIILEGSSKGVISNEDGSFRIPAEFKSEFSGLIISSMGYESVSVSKEDLSDSQLNTIYLVPKTIELQEATVVGYKDKLSAKEIVRKAIRAIPDNFSTNPFSIVGYYRDYQQDNSKYVNLNEAIVEVQDKGFGQRDSETTDFRIYRLVKNQDFLRDSISSSSYDYDKRNKVLEKGFLPAHHGNELIILRVHDAIRNYDYRSYSFVDKMKKDLIGNHNFTLGRDVYLDGEWLYSINFETKMDDVFAKGQIMISKKDFGIYALQYEVHPLNQSRLIFEIQSEYRPYQGKMYLSYLSFSNSFKLKLPPAFQVKNTYMDMESRVIVIHFNNVLDFDSAKSPEHYELFFNKRNIPLQVLKVYVATKKVVLKPMFSSERIEKQYYEAIKNDEQGSGSGSDMIVCKVEGIKDIQGNVLGVSESKSFLQFREYFTQNIIIGDNKNEVGAKMNKNRPLFENVTSNISFDSVQQYWMNTPLQKAQIPN